MKIKGLKISLFFIFILIIIFFFIFNLYQKVYGDRVITNLWLGEYNLNGLTKKQVERFLEEKIAEIEKRGIKISAQDKEIVFYPVIIALNDPDLTRRVIYFKPTETIDEIFFVSQKLGIFRRLSGKKRITLAFDLNEEEILKILKESFSSLEKPPQNASLRYESGNWKIIPEENGFSFNYQRAISDLKERLGNINFKPISLSVVLEKPEIYQKDIEISLEEAERIANLAPIILSYGKEKWTVTKEILNQWIDFKKENGKISVDLNQKKIDIFLEKLAPKINQPVQEAKFKMENERVIEFQVAREGRKLEIEKSSEKIKKYIFSNIKEIELEVTLEKPTVFVGDINNLGIKELVGRGESDFKGSPKNRINNIKVGAKILNGILIKPGEEFSLLKALGEVSEKRGYLPELVIKANRTVPELGGGLCQIGTTAFRVALAAGLPITQRTPHAFRVIYYEPAGVDATIYQPSPDFRFINDYQSWLLLQTKIEKTKLIFELYGTSDGRRVELSPPKIFNIVPPGPPKYIETNELSPGQKKLVEKPVAGADTEFTQIIIYPNGEKKEIVWKSHYRPWPEVWLVGKEKTENQ